MSIAKALPFSVAGEATPYRVKWHGAYWRGVDSDATLRGMSPTRLNLRYWRDAKGLSQEALAKAAGLSRGMVIRMEAGQIKGIRLDTLDRLAEALGMREPRDLFVTEPPGSQAPARALKKRR